MDTNVAASQPKAETGVPVPDRRRVYAYLYTLNAGESVPIPEGTNRRSLRASVTYVQKTYGKRFTIRNVGGSCRVWRLS